MTPAVQGIIVVNVLVYFLQVTIVQPADVASWLGYTPGL